MLFASPLLAALLAAPTPFPAAAQQGPADTTRVPDTVYLTPVAVTATRSSKDVFLTPAPVSVFDRSDIRAKAPNTLVDLFRGQAGLDVSGVGLSQVRPVIRGQRGQRILLLADGLRLNNSRRQHGRGGVRYSSADGQQRVYGAAGGRSGRWGLQLAAAVRGADDYDAPRGDYGNITLASDTRVRDTRGQDWSVDAYVGYHLGEGRELFAHYERYRADISGGCGCSARSSTCTRSFFWSVGRRSRRSARPVTRRRGTGSSGTPPSRWVRCCRGSAAAPRASAIPRCCTSQS